MSDTLTQDWREVYRSLTPEQQAQEAETQAPAFPGTKQALAARLEQFGNDCHDPETGEFCPTDGGSSAADEAEANQDPYRGQHQPPRNAPTLDNLGGEDDPIFPADVYDHPEYYSHGGDNNYDKESARVLRSVRGKPDAPVKLYRAAPAGADSINKGDWVAISKSYAQMHAESQARPGETWHVYEITVPAKTVRNGGNDVIEWGYWGKDMPAKIVGTVNGDDYQAPEHFSLDTLMGRSLAAERVQWLETLSNTCHTPSGPGGGQFCGDTVDAGNLNAAEKKSVSAAFKAIEKVHELSLGTSKAYVEMSNSESMGSNTDGSYSADENRILLNEDKQNNAVTFVHEFGHHLSMGQGHSLQDQIDKSTSLRAWKDAVANSDTIQGLKERYDSTEDPYDGYLLDYREIFARSYAQWVTLRSGNKTLKNQFDALDVNMTWGAKEFEPIAKALDAHFKTARDRKAALSARLQEFSNPNHEPAGSPTGGRFAPKAGGGGGGFTESLLGPAIDTIQQLEGDKPPSFASNARSYIRAITPADKSTWFDDKVKPDGSPSDQMKDVLSEIHGVGDFLDGEINRRLSAPGSGFTGALPAQDPEKTQIQQDLASLTDSLSAPQAIIDDIAKGLGFPDGYASADVATQNRIKEMAPDAFAQLSDARNKMVDLKDKLNGSYDYLGAYAEMATTVLGEVRSFGEEALKTGGDKTLTGRLGQLAGVYPDDWIAASNDQKLIKLQADPRGSYNNDTGILLTTGGDSNMVHELAHRMAQVNPWIKQAEWTFYEQRTRDANGVQEPLQSLKQLAGGSYTDDELARPDKFIDPYMGKEYVDDPNNERELFSMGVENLFYNNSVLVKDKDYTKFVLGLLAAG